MPVSASPEADSAYSSRTHSEEILNRTLGVEKSSAHRGINL